MCTLLRLELLAFQTAQSVLGALLFKDKRFRLTGVAAAQQAIWGRCRPWREGVLRLAHTAWEADSAWRTYVREKNHKSTVQAPPKRSVAARAVTCTAWYCSDIGCILPSQSTCLPGAR